MPTTVTNRVWIYDSRFNAISVCAECRSSRKHKRECRYATTAPKTEFVPSPYLLARLQG